MQAPQALDPSVELFVGDFVFLHPLLPTFAQSLAPCSDPTSSCLVQSLVQSTAPCVDCSSLFLARILAQSATPCFDLWSPLLGDLLAQSLDPWFAGLSSAAQMKKVYASILTSGYGIALQTFNKMKRLCDCLLDQVLLVDTVIDRRKESNMMVAQSGKVG